MACAPQSSHKADRWVLGGKAFGTTYQIIAYPVEGIRGNARTLKTDVEALIASFNSSLSTYQADSEISRFNQAPVDTWITVSDRFYHAVTLARELSDKTHGQYDITIGALTQLYGFGGGNEPGVAPDAETLAAARELVGYKSLETRKRDDQYQLRKAKAIILDVSSISKGQAVDELAQLLKTRGIKSYLIEIGGEIRVGDSKPTPTAGDDKEAEWVVAVERPTNQVKQPAKMLALTNHALATSGEYRNFFLLPQASGTSNAIKRYSHTIDPRTGDPISLQRDELTKADVLLSVTVVARTCMLADAWATALNLHDPQTALKLARQFGINALFIYSSPTVDDRNVAYGFTTSGDMQSFLVSIES